MSHYYETRKNAINLIDDLIQQGKTKDAIVFQISKRFGFGNKIVNERFELIERLRNQDAS